MKQFAFFLVFMLSNIGLIFAQTPSMSNDKEKIVNTLNKTFLDLFLKFLILLLKIGALKINSMSKLNLKIPLKKRENKYLMKICNQIKKRKKSWL